MIEKQMDQLLKDYHWMINSVKIIREGMNDIGQGLNTQYGLQAAMPKASGLNSDPIYREVERRDKRWKKINEYEGKIKAVQDRIQSIHVDREVEVLHWLLEGKSMRWIGSHMTLSDRHIGRIRESIIRRMSQMSDMSHSSQK